VNNPGFDKSSFQLLGTEYACSVAQKTPPWFSNCFHMDQLAKINRHHWKERLKISKVAKFESDRMKTKNDMALQSRKFL